MPCGLPSQPVCTAGLACRSGACADLGTNRCVASGQYGSDGGVVCLTGNFVACGGAGQSCCQNSSCDGGCCAGQRCVVPDAGCGGQTYSYPALGACSGTTSSCGSCGGLTEPCCPSTATYQRDFCTASGLVCNNSNQCVACGGPGQACCLGNLCANGGCCTSGTCTANNGLCPSGGGPCKNGSCSDGGCGSVGQNECGGSLNCTGPYALESGNSCVACGGDNQPCCDEYAPEGNCGAGYVCYAYTCRPCGAPNQRCCNGRFCNNGAACDVFGQCP